MTPPPSTGDPVKDAENMRSFANQYAQMYGSDNARQMGYTGPDIPGHINQSAFKSMPAMDGPARGPSSPYAFMGMAGDQSNSFEREQELARLQQMQGDQPRGPDQNPSMGMATDTRNMWYSDDAGSGERNRDGAYGGMTRPAQELNGGPLASGIFGAGVMSKVERGANVPDWMINNPNFDPMVPVAMVHAEYMNPATGETFNQTGDRYMVDPSLKGDFVNNTLLSGDFLPSSQGGNNLLGANLSSGIFGASPPPNSSSPTSLAPLNRKGFMQTQQPEMRGFDERHREQHSQMGNGGGYSPMGGGLMDLASAQSNYGSSPFMAPASGSSGYQTGSPFGSMPSPFGGGLSRGYYT